MIEKPRKEDVDRAIRDLKLPDSARVGVLSYEAPDCRLDISKFAWLRPLRQKN